TLLGEYLIDRHRFGSRWRGESRLELCPASNGQYGAEVIIAGCTITNNDFGVNLGINVRLVPVGVLVHLAGGNRHVSVVPVGCAACVRCGIDADRVAATMGSG